MLKVRLMTVIIGLPIVLYVLILGPRWSALVFFSVVIALSVYETALMLLPRLDEIYKQIRTTDQPVTDFAFSHFKKLALFCSMVGVTMLVIFGIGDRASGAGVIVFGLIIVILLGVFATEGIDIEMARVFGYLVSITYGGLPWLVVWDLYESAPHARYLILLLSIVWAGDSGAYFGGRFFGKHKLAPHKSPKKTWEGALAGLIGSVLGATICCALVTEIFSSFAQILAAGLFVGVFGQLGDLVESVFKRFSQVKDSGRLLPGHGGLLDRTDGLLTGAPALWFILHIFSL